ncbi:MAG: ParB N-terminal domain-containing protein [Chloroflexota bacterium]|nr:ParB N-terminal domain-containing protein [Chloroflexota bacterium]
MKTMNVPSRSLREHPAQMRTEMDPHELARLVLQVCERGLDPHQPILAADNGDGTYRVVSGHRRWLAALLAEEVKARIDRKEDGVDLDFARRVVFGFAARPTDVEVCAFCGEPLEKVRGAEGWCGNCENWVEARVEPRDLPSPAVLPGAYGSLTERYGDLQISIALFEGDEKEEILALQAANFGHETPDLLGQARSYAAAVKAGATADEIATNTGQSVSRVEAILSLNKVPEYLAQAAVAGDVALGGAAAVARLRNKGQREGMARYVLEQDVTVEGAQQIGSALRKWKPPAVSLDPEMTPQARNQARVAAALWTEVLEADPARAWYAAACVAGNGAACPERTCPERSRRSRRDRSLLAWIRWLGVEESEEDLLYRLAPEARCENCRLRELLQAAPPFSYPRYPCKEVEEYQGTCFHGVFGQDPFYVQIPFGWEEYPGVQRTTRTPVCLSPEDFEQAIEAATAGFDEDKEVAGPGQGGDFTASPGSGYSLPGTGVSDVKGQRALIRSYMEHHSEMSGARHPVATCCEDCRYRLEGSPTKDPTVPPCQWAARRRVVEFLVRVPVEEEGVEIPLCRQFAPSRSWNDVIPDHPEPPGVPRQWMVGVIRQMVQAVERRKAAASDSRLVCEFLTGRPLRVSDSHKGWFLDGLENEIGNLSNGQLWTLAMWVTADWTRDQEGSGVYLLPLADGRVLCYAERAWQPPAEPEESEESA